MGAEPAGSRAGERDQVAAIEVTVPIARAARLVKEIDLIPRFMLHEGKKQIVDLFNLRETLAAELLAFAQEKGTAT